MSYGPLSVVTYVLVDQGIALFFICWLVYLTHRLVKSFVAPGIKRLLLANIIPTIACVILVENIHSFSLITLCVIYTLVVFLVTMRKC